MSQMVGADVEALEMAAQQLITAADEFDTSAGGLASSLGALRWIGDVAVRFTDLWSGVHNPRMAKTSGCLREAAEALRRQAEHQRAASLAAGSGAAWAGSGGGGDAKSAQEQEQQRLADALAADLRRVRSLSAAEQLAWWNSLSDAQREALLAIRPGELTALNLPADVLATAQANYTSQIADDLLTSTTGMHGELAGKVLWIRAEAGFDAEMRLFNDGSVELDLSGYVGAGAGAGDAEALAKLGMGGTFEFASEAEARQWLNDLGAAALKGDLQGFLEQSASHLGSVRVEASVEGSASLEAGGVGASVGAEVGLTSELDTRGEGAGDVTLTARQSFSGELKGGVLGVSGEVELTASATFDGVTPKEIKFSMSYEQAALTGHFSPVSEVSAGATSSGTAELTFDLTQPELRSAAEQAAAALKRGDVAGATQALAGVMDRAQIVVRQEVGAQSTSGFDVDIGIGGVKGELSTSTSTTTATYVKPPGGSFYEVK